MRVTDADTKATTQDDSSVYAMPLPSLRGIATLSNKDGVAHDLTTLRKWIRLNKVLYKTDRIDLRTTQCEAATWLPLAEFAEWERIQVSPRVPSACSPDSLDALHEAAVYDVCIEHGNADNETLGAWLDVVKGHNLPARVILVATPETLDDIGGTASVLQGACTVTICASDPFAGRLASLDKTQGSALIRQMNILAKRLDEAGVDTCLTGLPFCLVDESIRYLAMNSAQYFLDHIHYQRDSFEFARNMFRFRSRAVNMAIESLLARHNSVFSEIDAAVFPWIQEYPRLYRRMWMYHKLTRYLSFRQAKPQPLPESADAYEAALIQYREKRQRSEGPVCARCRYRKICDKDAPPFRERFPRVGIVAQSGDALAAAPSQTQPRPRYYDVLDDARRRLPQRIAELAEAARLLMRQALPTREIPADAYDISGRYTHHMPGAVQWLSFGTGELESTVLARIKPPFTLSFTVGGGIATHVGFSFGRHAKIVCPMIDYAHRITLSVDDNGYYVMLRDGQVVQPTEFERGLHVPSRLGDVLEPRLNLHNIDGMIVTQTVMLWEGGAQSPSKPPAPKYSVIIISTRFTRRLQATLLALAHQQGIPTHLFEVIIGYVPDIDATDDLIDSIGEAFPGMRIIRVAFAEGREKSKGFIINESVRAASGKWILLMDADIVAPPNTFALIETIEAGRHFIAPDGRKMLPSDVTGKILLNELRPWEHYNEIMEGPGEIRKREALARPIGFFQCVRREILERIPYNELNHFEASDWHFGRQVAVNYGREYRMQDFYVLHLDHGGSQWYGTHKYR